MPDSSDDRKRRPPPILIPAVPRITASTQATRTNTNEQEQEQKQQHQQPSRRNASSSTQQGSRFGSSPLTLPLEHDISRVPLPKSGSQKSRTSAITNLTGLMEEARQGPRELALVGIGPSTIHSKQSTRSRANSGQTRHDADQKTTRAWIEARSEQHVFKMAGQVSPTHLANAVGDGEVLIKTQDLREECRAASEEQKGKSRDPVKSPKRKLFGMHLPNFGRSSTPNAPPMPPKAAQVLGQEPRNPIKLMSRSTKPAASQETPTKAPRSDTAKSLPAKLLNPDKHVRSHHTGATRRHREVSRRSPPRVNKLPSTAENPFLGTESSFASAPPPTPPAKDTPPDGRDLMHPASPLRRMAPLDGLREVYRTDVDVASGPLRFPAFALSPSPTKIYEHGVAGKSPSKHAPSTAEDYQKLIAGQPLPWPSPLRDDSNPERVASQPASSQAGVEDTGDTDSLYRDDGRSAETHQHGDSHGAAVSYRLSHPPNLPQPSERSSADYPPYIYSNHGSHHYSPLQPRFYSPSNRSVLNFADGETPSKNSDTTRFYCAVPKTTDDSNNASIEMMFQGDAHDIEPQSSTGRLAHNDKPDPMRVQNRDDSGLAARVMQELRIGEQQDQPPRQHGTTSLLHPDQSSSRLTDILDAVSPGRYNYESRLPPTCPSAVPSPLHKAPAPVTPMQGMPQRQNSSILPGSARTPKTIDDHFYMTNEHLDVVGKSNWDQIETLKKELHDTSKHRHEQLVTTVEDHVKGIKIQVDSVNEKTDRTTEQGHNIHSKLEQLFNFIRNDVMSVLAAQDKKTTGMEQSIKELQKTVHNLQKMLEQKQAEAKAVQQHTPIATNATPNSPFPHRAQTSLAGFYGNMTESGREGPPGLQMPERTTSLAYDGHTDARAAYGSNYGQQWGPRSNFQGRNSKEERSYSGTNPYQFANNGANGGQFGNGYNGSNGYSPYSPVEQPYSFHQGQSK